MSRSKLDNVVRLDDHLKRSQRGNSSKPSSLLKHCRDLVSSRLSGALPVVLDKLDDALFDLADQSLDNSEQSLYFATMREVRVKRSNMENEFKRHFKNSVNSTIKRLAGHEGPSFLNSPDLKLALLDDNDYEETLAITNMVQKIRVSSQTQLYGIERRVAHLLRKDEIKGNENPFGPELICNAFKDACTNIDAEVGVRLILLKLFERHVGSKLGEIYSEVNDCLIKQGVLPEIRHEIRNVRTHNTYRPGGVRAEHAEPGNLGESSPAVVPRQEPSTTPTVAPVSPASGTDLLNALRQVMNVNYAGSVGTPAPGAQQLEVINQLTLLQHGDSQAACEELASLDVSGVHTGTVNVLRDLKTTQVTTGIGEIDAMMFDVVAMMFDYILDDEKIPAPMKALIGRLQIPMLKVAILDKGLFARKFHPARKLLNSLAEAAVGWSEDQGRNDFLFDKMEVLVMRILDEFDEHVEIFEDVLNELESFLDEEDARAEQTATASTDAIEGRERLSSAKHNATEHVHKRLGKAEVHDLVREFLFTHWKELLFIRHFEEGENGHGWKSALQTMDDLVWSVAPKTLNEDRHHLTDLLPDLLRRVRDGMKQLGMPAEISGRFLGALKKLHIAAIRNVHCDGDPDSIDETPRIPQVQVDEMEWTEEESYSVEELSLIQLAVERANDVIHGTAEERPECAGMGTTLVAAQFHDNRVTVAHVGDARLYRLRDDELSRMTSDHSLQQQLVDKGFYSSEEVKQKICSNLITRAVGADSTVDVDMQELEVEVGDLYLLCSDGLTDMVSDEDIFKILRAYRSDLAMACDTLVDTANESGGEDNISAVLVRVRHSFADRSFSDEDLDLGEYLEMHGLSDVGRKRSHNEDHIALDLRRGIAIVADGMGGCNAGEVASEMAAKIVLEALRGGSVDVIAVTGATKGSRGCTDHRPSTCTAAASALLEHHNGRIVIDGLDSDVQFDPDEEDEHTLIVRELEVGNWVEFRHSDDSSVRARLTWISPVTGRYLFTDRKGLKVVDSSVYGLAVEMKRGAVSMMEDVPLFDRIMGNITSSLRSNEARMH